MNKTIRSFSLPVVYMCVSLFKFGQLSMSLATLFHCAQVMSNGVKALFLTIYEIEICVVLKILMFSFSSNLQLQQRSFCAGWLRALLSVRPRCLRSSRVFGWW